MVEVIVLATMTVEAVIMELAVLLMVMVTVVVMAFVSRKKAECYDDSVYFAVGVVIRVCYEGKMVGR